MSEIAPAVLDRFVDKVSVDVECWPWLGATQANGYGRFWFEDRVVPAHRFAYEWLVGPIPDGLQIDHLCRGRGCVNPAHMEPVTQRENLRRGYHTNREKTHCKNGHPFDEETTSHRKSGGRTCLICQRQWYKDWYWRQKDRRRR